MSQHIICCKYTYDLNGLNAQVSFNLPKSPQLSQISIKLFKYFPLFKISPNIRKCPTILIQRCVGIDYGQEDCINSLGYEFEGKENKKTGERTLHCKGGALRR